MESPRLRERAASPPLGAALVAAGLLDEHDLAVALEQQTRSRRRLGEVLVRRGIVPRLDLARVLAERARVPFVTLVDREPRRELLEGLDLEACVRERLVPIDRDDDGTLVVASSEVPTDTVRESAERLSGAPVRLVLTTEWDLLRYIVRAGADHIGRRAAYGLAETDLDLSAAHVLTRAQAIGLVVVAVVVVLVGIVDTRALLGAALAGAATLLALVVLFRAVVAFRGAGVPWVVPERLLDDADLPTYTILVPLYREAAVVPALMTSLANLDYPPEKLEALVLVEADDDATRDALVAARPPSWVTVVTVPPEGPATKPKALNVGLALASGELLVIYDAEDRPEPDQLRIVASIFADADHDLACVQAALNYHNARHNLLTRLFTLEYSQWFDYLLPGLEALELPIPLGGTSNHFRTQLLRSLGGWDPFNVTEDADLGIRAAVKGARVATAASTTWEEATARPGAFIRQRTRWIKGYVQTALVHARHPIRLVRAVGPIQALAFAVLIAGTPIAFWTIVPLDLTFVASLVLSPHVLVDLVPRWALAVGFVDLVIGNAVVIYLSIVAVFRRRQWSLVWAALLTPVYWILHSLAAYRALAQLVTRPHYWDKTDHGVAL
ncbi:General secretory system II protein E domain protein [Acidimicrobium ferrooxidans DSM 10331]|uniref:General secretory system II protein E domain protein n=1 Tax=Acidimicrobium ferrooxidans (strain DSM 10331 / JCM 15462 / NBRC 103882 / ICP) TaxID=525909 RepID=C7M1V6_ACIFD|nr:glycosyltransferase [Acidimicrobium ferrooxidans]ACU54853.1 General secretory system II protein E domain protein [Acidimicrobium ferrooxidans DSM 10331]